MDKSVGKVYFLDLNSDRSYANLIVLRKKDNISPIILGQFVLLADSPKSKSKYLAVVEKYTPDIDMLEHKNSIKQALGAESGIDDNYKEGAKAINYRARLLGIVHEEGSSLKFYSNVRDCPIVTDLEVYIPDNAFLQKLFHEAVSQSDNEMGKAIFEIGKLRYGTFPEYTDAFYGEGKEVPIYFDATNLLRKRTGIFGKSGYGKSNTVKTVIGMMATKHPKCGQLIIDTNGEYALSNTQNDGLMDIFHEGGLSHKIVLYTGRKVHEEKIAKHGKDAFKPLRFDVFENIGPSIEIIMANFSGDDNIPMYLEPWKNAVMGGDDPSKMFDSYRSQAKAIIWSTWFKCCLDAGLVPLNKKAVHSPTLKITKEFLTVLLNEVLDKEELDQMVQDKIAQMGGTFNPKKDERPKIEWDEITKETQEEILETYGIFENKDGKRISYSTKVIETMSLYAEFYAQVEKAKDKRKKDGEVSISGNSSLKGFFELLNYSRRLYQLKPFNIGELKEKGHKPLSLGEKIWADLEENKVVILDMASIPIRVAKSLNQQILGYLLTKASDIFGDTTQIKRFNAFDALIYIEESQNYLSPEQTKGGGVYERVAKEGRKFHLGLVYITQQPSAIDSKITSQTENIIAMHMSNKEDTFILGKIKDKFDDLTCKFLKDEAQKGLAYIYSEPHQPFVLPCQIHLFNKELVIKNLRKKGK